MVENRHDWVEATNAERRKGRTSASEHAQRQVGIKAGEASSRQHGSQMQEVKGQHDEPWLRRALQQHQGICEDVVRQRQRQFQSGALEAGHNKSHLPQRPEQQRKPEMRGVRHRRKRPKPSPCHSRGQRAQAHEAVRWQRWARVEEIQYQGRAVRVCHRAQGRQKAKEGMVWQGRRQAKPAASHRKKSRAHVIRLPQGKRRL